MRRVEVVPPDPNWRAMFEQEAEYLATALSSNVGKIHHMGSTAIPGIYAKPIIDLLIEVESLAAVDQCNRAMQALGYEAMGEFGIPGRRFFRKDNQNGIRTHHVHIFEADSPQVDRHLAFRDYIIAHPEKAQAYSDLKCQLAAQHPTDIEAYMDGKDEFIRAIDQAAAIWASH